MRDSKPITAPAYPELTRQLMAHQEALTVRFLQQPWRHAAHPRYVIPLPQEDFMRCWGRSTSPEEKGMEFERSDCMMDSRVFVSGWLTTGTITTRHEAYDGRKLGALRFAQRYSASFRNEQFGGAGKGADHAPVHRAVRRSQRPAGARRAVHGSVQEAGRAVRRERAGRDRGRAPGWSSWDDSMRAA